MNGMRGVLLAGVIAAAMVLGGCGLSSAQRQATVRFADATSALAELSAQEFKQSRLDVIEMNTARRRLGDTGVRAEVLDENFELSAVQARVDMVEALSRYADLLKALATGSESANLQTASDNLVASLTRLGKVKGLELNASAEQLGSLGSIVRTAGEAVTEQMRADAVREVVLRARPVIRGISELLKRDFTIDTGTPSDEFTATWADNFVNGTYAMLQRRIANPGPLAGRAQADAGDVEQARIVGEQSRQRFIAVAGRVVSAADALAKAQYELVLATQTRTLTTDDIDTLVAKVRDLSVAVRVLSKN